MNRLLSCACLLALTACGSGGGGEAAPPALPEIQSVNQSLDGLVSTPFAIEGAHFPGETGTVYAVRFVSAMGPVFDDCNTTEITGSVTWQSPTLLTGSTPATHVLGDTPAYVVVEFPAGPVTSDDPIATFIGTPDPLQDQDGNGVRDGCDPQTYDFESDSIGARPADATQLGLAATMEVSGVPGNQVARYAAGSNGAYDRLDRVMADTAHQNTTVYVDWDDVDGVGSIELWSEGSHSDYAGGGLIVQVRNGLIYFYQRTWRSVPSVIGSALPTNRRMRIRVLKGPGTTSNVHIDAWSGSDWTPDHVVFPVANDSFFRGRNTSLAAYSGGARGIERITVVHEAPSGALNVMETPEGLMPWKLFQRSAADLATIPVDATYTLTTSGKLQARVVASDGGLALAGHDWANHEVALAAQEGARAHLDIAGVPTGGSYDVHVRLLDDLGTVLAQEGVRDIAVGDVYICAGQSNMSGYSGSIAGATTPHPLVRRFHNNGQWTVAEEPVDAPGLQVDRISRESPAHSLMLPFGTNLLNATGVPVALVPTSLGGTNLHTQWQRNAARPDWRATLYGSMLHRARVATGGLPPAGFLWFQGESDAINARTMVQYRADMQQLLANVRSDLNDPDMPVVHAQLGTFSSAPLDLWLGVQEAQRQVARDDDHTSLVTTVDQPRADGIHFNVAGYKAIGARFADAMHVLKFRQTLDPLTELVSFRLGATTSEMVLTYDGSVSGGAAALFGASDDGGLLTVTGVVTNGDAVTLTFDRAVGANVRVSYGRSVTPTDAWIIDSRGVPVPCFDDVGVN